MSVRPTTELGVSYGVGLLYFDRHGGSSIFTELRVHHVNSPHVGTFIPLTVGVIF